MNEQEIVRAASDAEHLLRRYGVRAERYSRDFTCPSGHRAASHALWCCREIRKMAGEGRREKAFRWLGFVQGVLFACGLATIDQLRAMNMPKEGGGEPGPEGASGQPQP